MPRWFFEGEVVMPKLNKDEVREHLYRACETPEQLKIWVEWYLGMKVPRGNVCSGHDAPFEYLQRAYFEPGEDLIVWAPRGGGKTRLGAAVTLLELLHKPGVQVRILGGSLEQSCRMWEHLEPDLRKLAGEAIDADLSTARSVTMTNGSKVGVLAQSQKAVRGLRVQKLRCDEVEMFDPKVWEAGLLTTRSLVGATTADVETQSAGAGVVKGAVEAISTFHKPWGLMSKVIENAKAKGIRVLHWCILEVMEKCPESRDCLTCDLWEDCQGVAKTKCDGFFAIDDLIRIKRRVSKESWDSEMMCRRPSVKGAVFPNFDLSVHVKGGIGDAKPQAAELRLGMDFGFNNPFVCLWILLHPDGVVHVVDEYVQESRMLHEHVSEIESRGWGKPKMIACDPARNGRNDQTAESNVSFLRRRGYSVRSKGSRIVDGIEMIRFALRPAAGEPTLFIDPRCVKLIAAMQGYHYAEGGSEVPVKDGSDHCVDALRYFFVNRGGQGVRWRKY